MTLQGDNELVVLDAFELESAAGLGSLVTRLGDRLRAAGRLRRRGERPHSSPRTSSAASTTLFEAGDVLRRRLDPAAVERSRERRHDRRRAAPADVLAGKRIFYNARDPRMSAEGYLCCATCHLDGGDDGRVWDFTGRGEGLRDTPAARARRHGARQRALERQLRRDPGLRERHPQRLRRHRLHGRRRLRRDRAAARRRRRPACRRTSTRSPPTSRRSDRRTVPRSPFRNADGSMTAAARRRPGALSRPRLHELPSRRRASPTRPSAAPTLHDVGTLRTTSGGRLGEPLTGIDTPTLLGLWTPVARTSTTARRRRSTTSSRVAGGAVLPAEAATPSGGAQIVSNYVELNNDDTVHGRAYVALGPQRGARAPSRASTAATGGIGAIELRYSSSGAAQVSVAVNGVAQNLALAAVGNDPSLAAHELADRAARGGRLRRRRRRTRSRSPPPAPSPT